jgi:hypothetical protein
MSDNQTQLVMLEDDVPPGKFVEVDAAAPGEVDAGVVTKKKRKARAVSAEPKERKRRANGEAGVKLQTQVPKEWRATVATLAKAQGVRESDVVRGFIAKGLGLA